MCIHKRVPLRSEFLLKRVHHRPFSGRWILVGLVLLLFNSAQASAQQDSALRAKQSVVIDAVGDGRFTVEIKMPMAHYMYMKDRTPNTITVLRQIGLAHDDCLEVQDVKG